MANVTVNRQNGNQPALARPATATATTEWEPARLMRAMLGWDPFREIAPLAFDDRATFVPAFEVKETKEGYAFKADVPGMNREDIHLTFENNVLTLSGERRFEKKDEADNYHRVERSYGTFTRSFAVQQTESIDHVTAEYNNGILRIDLPKHEEVKARRIEIAGGDSPGTRTIEAQVANAPAKQQKATAQAAGA